MTQSFPLQRSLYVPIDVFLVEYKSLILNFLSRALIMNGITKVVVRPTYGKIELIIIVCTILYPTFVYQSGMQSQNGPWIYFVKILGQCSVMFPLTNKIKIPVLKNQAMNTPLVIEASCSLLVSSPTHVIPLIITVFKTRLMAMMMNETEVPRILDHL